MARSSHGSRRSDSWAITRPSRPQPRIVRLGRPANDNARRFGAGQLVAALLLASSLLLVGVMGWRLL